MKLTRTADQITDKAIKRLEQRLTYLEEYSDELELEMLKYQGQAKRLEAKALLMLEEIKEIIKEYKFTEEELTKAIKAFK